MMSAVQRIFVKDLTNNERTSPWIGVSRLDSFKWDEDPQNYAKILLFITGLYVMANESSVAVTFEEKDDIFILRRTTNK